MPNESDTPKLRLAHLQFPTDALTIADLRRDQPILFSEEGLFRSYDDSLATSMNVLTYMLSERILAKKAFANAAGLPDLWPQENRRDEILDLNEYYVKMGLSKGLEQTKQMVGDFEQASVRQAGPPRGRSR